MYIDGVARTNKLHCSVCCKDIKKGSSVIFELKNGRMTDVFCGSCKEEYSQEIIERTSTHPLDVWG